MQRNRIRKNLLKYPILFAASRCAFMWFSSHACMPQSESRSISKERAADQRVICDIMGIARKSDATQTRKSKFLTLLTCFASRQLESEQNCDEMTYAIALWPDRLWIMSSSWSIMHVASLRAACRYSLYVHYVS